MRERVVKLHAARAASLRDGHTRGLDLVQERCHQQGLREHGGSRVGRPTQLTIENGQNMHNDKFRKVVSYIRLILRYNAKRSHVLQSTWSPAAWAR